MKAIFALALLTVAGMAQAAPDGATIYNRCAACHTRTGAGVPGAYPPLGADFRSLAAKPGGRRYLALAVIKGLNGPISVEGKPYRGMMPAQGGLDDMGVAAVLNHVGGTISKVGPAFKPFTDQEVAGYRAGAKALGSADVAKLHEGAGGK
ncbi:MAG: cytochrome c [Sphingopyxis sp.]|nr:cytochrome c [Sphingopyxis sp.]